MDITSTEFHKRLPMPLPNGRGSDGWARPTLRVGVSAFPRFHVSGRAFSLIEMMIAIIILGLGLVMTATMFPVAWTRARTLTEYTTQRSIAASAESILADTLKAAGSSNRVYMDNSNVDKVTTVLTSGSLAGDFFYDPTLPGADAVLSFSDTRVHALNVANLLVSPPAPDKAVVDEDPWRLERMFDIPSNSLHPISSGEIFMIINPKPKVQEAFIERFFSNSFYTPRVSIDQRMFPPLETYPAADPLARERWLERFSTRRFAWAALHRLKSPVGPSRYFPIPIYPDPMSPAELALAAGASGTTRVFDLYVVTLRRAQATSRYAQQDPKFAPNSLNSSDAAMRDRSVIATPRALDLEDVMLPAPWRVQIELPPILSGSGLPTEVQAPPTAVAAASRPMLVGMFPGGTQFVDEINGQVYRVIKRRTNAAGDTAFLTLDREIHFDEVNDGEFPHNPPPLEDDEYIRTVWVYPPPVDRTATSQAGVVVFEGSSPVVGIELRTLSVSPPG